MINLRRRKRQAFENAGNIIQNSWSKFFSMPAVIVTQQEVHDLQELNSLIKEFEAKAILLGKSLQTDWAIPIILQAVSELYYGKYRQYNQIGNSFKRTLSYLWPNVGISSGGNRNVKELEELIHLCHVVETLYAMRSMFIAIPDFSFQIYDRYITIPDRYHEALQRFGMLNRGKGTRFRVAKENTRLMNTCLAEFHAGLASILNGTSPKDIEIFKNTFYEDVPGIENSECQKFWKEIFFRYSMYTTCLAALAHEENVCDIILLEEFAFAIDEAYCSQDIVYNSFWRNDWFRLQDPERYGNLIVDRPILRISSGGVFATSPVLLGDSLNSFVETQLLGYSSRYPRLNLPDTIFKTAFSEKFENECIHLFRTHGFLAGHILESGVWINQNKTVNLCIDDEKPYGEIDVFAYSPHRALAILVECKVLLDLRDSRSYRNIVAKLKDDSEGFRMKMRKKAAWLKKGLPEHAFSVQEPLMLLVTDIPLPVLETDEEDIAVIDILRLQDFLESNS